MWKGSLPPPTSRAGMARHSTHVPVPVYRMFPCGRTCGRQNVPVDVMVLNLHRVYVSLRTYLWTSKNPCGRHGTKSTQSLHFPADVPVDVKNPCGRCHVTEDDESLPIIHI